MVTGTVKWFDSKKGFGFILGAEEGKDIFVHYTNIEGEGFRSLKDGESVEFDMVDSGKGLQAQNVRRAGKKSPQQV
jgi:CspA family cold shock protein